MSYWIVGVRRMVLSSGLELERVVHFSRTMSREMEMMCSCSITESMKTLEPVSRMMLCLFETKRLTRKFRA